MSRSTNPIPSQSRPGATDRKAGIPIWRILSVLFFIGACCVFLGGGFYWLRKNQSVKDFSRGKHYIVTPEVLKDDILVTQKDKVDYSYWPVAELPPSERQKAFKQCLQVAQDFLNGKDVVSKSSLVWSSLEMLPIMVKHYSENSPELVMSKAKGPKNFIIFNVEGRPCAQMSIAFTESPDMEFAFFRDDSGDWKLDWKQFARWQPQKWDDFARGEGDDIGEFRIWLILDRTSNTAEDYAFKVIVPGRNGSDNRCIARPTIMIPRNSPEGKYLFMLTKLDEEMEGSPFKTLGSNDEKDAVRVRAIIARSKEMGSNGAYTFSLAELVGEGWYGVPPQKKICPNPLEGTESKAADGKNEQSL